MEGRPTTGTRTNRRVRRVWTATRSGRRRTVQHVPQQDASNLLRNLSAPLPAEGREQQHVLQSGAVRTEAVFTWGVENAPGDHRCWHRDPVRAELWLLTAQP